MTTLKKRSGPTRVDPGTPLDDAEMPLISARARNRAGARRFGGRFPAGGG